jgi:hypothetical protein
VNVIDCIEGADRVRMRRVVRPDSVALSCRSLVPCVLGAAMDRRLLTGLSLTGPARPGPARRARPLVRSSARPLVSE